MKKTFEQHLKYHTMVALMILPLLSACDQDQRIGGWLDGTKWNLAAWSVSSLHPGAFTITADFDDASVSGTAAVNSYGAPYAATVSGAFSLGTMTMTDMAGSEDAMRAEELYVKLLLQAKKYRVGEATLTLYDQNENELLTFNKR